MKKRTRVLVFFLTALLLAGAGCSRKSNDAKISSDIQAKFSQDSGLSGKQLTVQASKGVVTLAGFVDNDAQRTTAARQAASVQGVKEIVNNLQVGSAPATAAGTAEKKMPQVTSSPKRTGKPGAGKKSARSSPYHDTMYDVAPTPAPAGDTSVTESSQPPASPPPNTPPAEAAPPTPAPPPPPHRVTIEQGTPISIRLIDSLDTEKNQTGDTFHASLNAPLSAEGAEVIPAGTDVTGHIVDLKSAGKFKGQSLIVLQLDSINANGTTYNLQTDQYRKEGSSRGKNTAEKVGGGAIIGGIIGAIAGGGKGAAIGSAAGAGVGGGTQAASKPKPVKLPSETVLNFTLQAPVTVAKPPNPNAGRPKLGDSH